MQRMNLIDLDEPTISSTQAAPYIPCDPYNLTLAARDPDARAALGFPVIVMGNRVRIPRIPFLKFLGLVPEDAAEAAVS